MAYIDPHIHMSVRTTDDYEAMYNAGYKAIIEPAFWSGQDKQYAGSFLDYFNYMLNFEHTRAEKYGLTHYTLICVNAKEARNTEIAREVIRNMEPYLEHPNCLGVGEVGLDLITPEEIQICTEQIRLCEKHKMLCIIHSPHTNKRAGVEQLFSILEQENVDMRRYIMDHNTEETIGISKSYSDIGIGITLYPTKVSIKRAAEMIKQHGADRVMLNSSADWGKSYPLMVSQAAQQMKEYGVTEEQIRKVTFSNARDFYSQSSKFSLGGDES